MFRQPIFIKIMIYCEQTAGPRSANFCKLMHVDKVHSYAIFIQNLDVLDLHFKVKYSIRVFRDCQTWLSRKQWQIWQTSLLPTQKAACGISIGILTFDIGPFYRSGSRPCTFRLLRSCKWWQIEQTLLLPTNAKLCGLTITGFKFDFNLF